MSIITGLARSIGRSVIPKLFTLGFTPTAGLAYLRKLGQGYRKTTFLADWREITGAKKLERVYRFIPKKYSLSYALMAPTETFQQHQYRYIFDVTGENLLTGERETRTMSLGTDRHFSIEEAEAEWREIMRLERGRYAEEEYFIADKIDLKVVYRKHKP